MIDPPFPPRFRFSDPRQERIHRRLRLISPGAAGLFKDACTLMADQPRLESTSHLVAHLLRETESSLRAVPIQSVADPADVPTKGQDKHAASIRAVLKGLDFKEDAEVAGAWLRLSGQENQYALGARAHRDALALPRPVDEEQETGGFPTWPLSRYVARMSATHPEAADAVLAVAASLPVTENVRVHEDVAEAAAHPRAAAAVQLVPRLKEWLGALYQALLPGPVRRCAPGRGLVGRVPDQGSITNFHCSRSGVCTRALRCRTRGTDDPVHRATGAQCI